MPNYLFERTPKYIYFNFGYKFTGVDGEYQDSIRIDLNEQWKDLQTNIGLR
jgi:hypothetical protein